VLCVRCGSFSELHNLERDGKRVVLCVNCLRQGALFVGNEQEIAAVMRPGQELWREGDHVYLLRGDFSKTRVAKT